VAGKTGFGLVDPREGVGMSDSAADSKEGTAWYFQQLHHNPMTR
jgi:hypothetical protein